MIQKILVLSFENETFPYKFRGNEELTATMQEMVCAKSNSLDTEKKIARKQDGSEGGSELVPSQYFKAVLPHTGTATTPWRQIEPPGAARKTSGNLKHRTRPTRSSSSLMMERAPVKRVAGKGNYSRGIDAFLSVVKERLVPVTIPDTEERSSTKATGGDIIDLTGLTFKDVPNEKRLLQGEEITVTSYEVHKTLRVLDISYDDYEQHLCVYEILAIQFPKIKLRSKNERHLHETIEKLRKFGWLTSHGSTALVVLEDVRAAVVTENKRRLFVTVVLVDGYHRVLVFLDPKKEDKKKPYIVAEVNITLWKREYGRRMTLNEVLWLGKTLKDLTSFVLLMSFADRIHTAVSFILNGVEQDGYELCKLTPIQATGEFWRRKTNENARKMSHFNRRSALSLKPVRNLSLSAFVDDIWQKNLKLVPLMYQASFHCGYHTISCAPTCSAYRCMFKGVQQLR